MNETNRMTEGCGAAAGVLNGLSGLNGLNEETGVSASEGSFRDTRKPLGGAVQKASGKSGLGASCLAACRKVIMQLANAKAAIFAEFREMPRGDERLLRLALTEAEALAWQTGFPQLVFPTLAMEKAQEVAGWHERQQWVRGGRSQL